MNSTSAVINRINNQVKNKFEFNLEALRGVAAFIVVVSHCFGFSRELNGLEQRQGIWEYEFPGHLAVLIFFILSGYVIGLTTKSLEWSGVGAYLNKRFLRLYPIYILCLCSALLVTHHHYSAKEILSNLFFLQQVTADSLYEIGANWSLNYEVLFYLLFIPLAIYKLRPAHVFVGSLAWALFFQLVVPQMMLAMYGFGFCFWVAGWWLAKTPYTVPAATSRLTLVGLLLLFLGLGPLNFAHEILRYTLHTDQLHGQLISLPTAILFSELSYLPFGLLVITYFTSKRLKYSGLLMSYCLAMPLLFALLQFKLSRTHSIDWSSQLLAYGFYLLACAFLLAGSMRRTTVTSNLPSWLIKAGSISYSVYLVHFLIIVLVGRLTFAYGSPTTFWLRLAVVLLLTPAVSYVLEKVWHPWAVQQLKKIPLFDTQPARARSGLTAQQKEFLSAK